tara:strand:+ start:1370 stop:1543 length:174 start_codon:yes stop_codon:yes gene_type:complete
MANHIKKTKTIAGVSTSIYYVGDKTWTTKFESRKVYSDSSAADADLYTQYPGTVVDE